jgi:uncharacterized protein (TIGR02246 family)
MKKLAKLLPMALLVAACGQAGDSGTPFSSRDGEWRTAMNAGDADGIAALYTEDARIMAPNGEATTGRDAVRSAFGEFIEAGAKVELNPIETQSAGDIAYIVGKYTLTIGGEFADRGKYVEIWRRGADGEWLMSNDIWNSDLPAPTAGSGDGGDKSHVMVVHEVEDFDRWSAAWRGDNNRHEMFSEHGVAHAHTFQNADNPNLTGVVLSISDMDEFNAFMASEEAADAASADGVDLDEATFLKEVE